MVTDIPLKKKKVEKKKYRNLSTLILSSTYRLSCVPILINTNLLLTSTVPEVPGSEALGLLCDGRPGRVVIPGQPQPGGSHGQL